MSQVSYQSWDEAAQAFDTYSSVSLRVLFGSCTGIYQDQSLIMQVKSNTFLSCPHFLTIYIKSFTMYLIFLEGKLVLMWLCSQITAPLLHGCSMVCPFLTGHTEIVSEVVAVPAHTNVSSYTVRCSCMQLTSSSSCASLSTLRDRCRGDMAELSGHVEAHK